MALGIFSANDDAHRPGIISCFIRHAMRKNVIHKKQVKLLLALQSWSASCCKAHIIVSTAAENLTVANVLTSHKADSDKAVSDKAVSDKAVTHKAPELGV